MSQLSDFLEMAQQGQEMSAESLYGTRIVFEGQGDPAGYAASGGAETSQLKIDDHGLAVADDSRTFRLLAAALTGLELKPEVTVFRAQGTRYRLTRIIHRPNDPRVSLVAEIL